MRAMCSSLLVVVCGWMCAVAAPAPKGEYELEGTRTVVSSEQDPALGRLPEGIVWVIASEKLTAGPDQGGDKALTYALKLDSTKDPKQIDLVGEFSGRRVVLRGVYRLEEGQLTVCLGVAAGDAKVVESERPARFEAGKDVQLLVLKWTRK